MKHRENYCYREISSISNIWKLPQSWQARSKILKIIPKHSQWLVVVWKRTFYIMIVTTRKSSVFSYERRQRIKIHESRKCENARYESRCIYTIFVLIEQLLRIWQSKLKKAGFHRCRAGKCGKYWRTVKWRALKARQLKIISDYTDVNERSNGVHASKSVFREAYKIFKGIKLARVKLRHRTANRWNEIKTEVQTLFANANFEFNAFLRD